MFDQSSLSSSELRRIAVELEELARRKRGEEKEQARKEREDNLAEMRDEFLSGFKMMDEQLNSLNENLSKFAERLAKRTEARGEVGDRSGNTNNETLELEEESKKDV